LNPKTNNLN